MAGSQFPLPKMPGESFPDIWNLTVENNWEMPSVFTNELLIGIFWEETLFNNIAQPNGTAVGYGQVEPNEFWRFAAGSFSKALILQSKSLSVLASSSMLVDLFKKLKRNRGETLYRYAGGQGRWPIVNRWENCEMRLLTASNFTGGEPWTMPGLVEEALQCARPFNAGLFHKALFPGDDSEGDDSES